MATASVVPVHPKRSVLEEEYIALTQYAGADSLEFATPPEEAPRQYRSHIARVVAVERLTETVAMVEFTRIKPWSGQLEDEHLAKLSTKKLDWYPAVQLNGEGIFIEFSLDWLKQWAGRAKDAYPPMMDRLESSFLYNECASAQYALMHTFAHLMIRQLSMRCGYSAASLKERIYSTYRSEKEAVEMAGVLIYTASPDAEGSLGGLVEQALPQNLERTLTAVLRDAAWCSSDPVCADVYGDLGQGVESFSYSAY